MADIRTYGSGTYGSSTYGGEIATGSLDLKGSREYLIAPQLRPQPPSVRLTPPQLRL